MGDEEPITFIPPLWVHNRAIVACDDHLYVLRRMRLRDNAETSTVDIVPIRRNGEADVDGAETISLARLLIEFTWARRTMSVMRAPQ